jgi:hypothetical protein
MGAPSGFSWSSFFEAIIALAVWAFAAGTVFGWLEGALLRDEKV